MNGTVLTVGHTNKEVRVKIAYVSSKLEFNFRNQIFKNANLGFVLNSDIRGINFFEYLTSVKLVCLDFSFLFFIFLLISSITLFPHNVGSTK